ncbi:hypothetical protein ACS0TY_006970 [Phlomoides rotata]
MHDLYEIHSDIGYIPTLECISLLNCSSISAAVSAIKILEEQDSLGNQGLPDFQYTLELERFKEHVEMDGLTGVNFQIGGA